MVWIKRKAQLNRAFQQEMDRLELQHLIWLEICGGRYNLAPLDEINVTHVLDIGTGTGSEPFCY